MVGPWALRDRPTDVGSPPRQRAPAVDSVSYDGADASQADRKHSQECGSAAPVAARLMLALLLCSVPNLWER